MGSARGLPYSRSMEDNHRLWDMRTQKSANFYFTVQPLGGGGH